MTQKPLTPTLREQKSRNRTAILKSHKGKGVMSEAELTQKERKQRTIQNRRGRKNPALVPDRLTRTSAFAPRRCNLNTDSKFSQIYEVPGYSVVEVRGRELGAQHRDAIYAMFRLKRETLRAPNPNHKPGTLQPAHITVYRSVTTWRELLRLMNLTQHQNNLRSLSEIFSDIKQVVFIIHEGKSLKDLEKAASKPRFGLRPDGPGSLSSIFEGIVWDGAALDSTVTVTYSTQVLEMFQNANLVSLNAQVQFSLKSDYAKTFWPFIDSQPSYHYVDEERLAQLAGKSLWSDDSSSATRAQFRKDCKQAFDDIVRAGGLETYRAEVTGMGWTKSRRYHYQHKLKRQLELELLPLEITP